MSLESLDAGHVRGAARVLADAFVDDPGWADVGPDDHGARWRYAYRTCLGAVRVARRWGGPSWCAVEDGVPAAVLTTIGPGLWPPPQLPLIAFQAPGALLAGPTVIARSLRAERVIERGHPEHPHVFVWMLAVSPRRQRSGLGRALMERALAVADAAAVPAYLDTANPANLPYYGSFGFRVLDEDRLPRGAPLWFMERPAGQAQREPV